MSTWHYVATFLNPKSLALDDDLLLRFALVEVYRLNEESYSSSFVIASPGEGGPEGRLLGDSYLDREDEITYDDQDYPRIHTPGGVARMGIGLGLMLYAGTALAVHDRDRRRWGGVHSPGDNERQPPASKFWHSAVKSGLAVRSETSRTEEVDDYCTRASRTTEACSNVRGDDYGRGTVVTEEVCGDLEAEGEVCGTVEVEYERAGEILPAKNVLATGFVLDYPGAAPLDPVLLARTSTSGLNDKPLPPVVVWRIYEALERRESNGAGRAFLAREDVQKSIREDRTLWPRLQEALGQRRIPGVAGLGRVGAPPLPPLTAGARALIERFKDVP